MVNGEKDLDLDLLAEIYERVFTPLVLHGGTGVSASSLKKTIPKMICCFYSATTTLQMMLDRISSGCRARNVR